MGSPERHKSWRVVAALRSRPTNGTPPSRSYRHLRESAASKTGRPSCEAAGRARSCATEPPGRTPETPQKRDPTSHPHSYGSPPSAWAMASKKPMGARAITWPSPAKARVASAWPIRQEGVAGFDDLGKLSARNLQKLSQQLPNLRQHIPYGHRRPLAYSGRDG